MLTADQLTFVDFDLLGRYLTNSAPIVLVDSFYVSSKLRAVRLGLSGEAADLAASQWNTQKLYRGV